MVIGGPTFVGFSEFEQVSQQITQELDGAQAANLSADDVTFLSKDTALDPFLVQAFADANRLAPALGVGAAVVYGLLRLNLPADAQKLANSSADLLRGALIQAVALNIVPASVGGAAIDTAIAAIQASAVTAALAPPPAGQVNLGKILSTTGAAAALQQSALKVFQDPTLTAEAAWAKIRTQAGAANAAVVDKMQFALQLGLLTHNHTPLITQLLGLSIGGHPVTSIRDLAVKTRADWFDLLAQNQGGQPIGVPADVPGNTADERRWNYATTLARAVEEAFPAAVLAARLGSVAAPTASTVKRTILGSPNSPLLNPPASVRGDVVRFIGQSPTFDLMNTRLDAFIAQNPGSVAGVAPAALPAMKDAVRGYQRLAKVTSRIDEVLALGGSGLGSAHGVASVGLGGLMAALGPQFGAERVNFMFANATEMSHAALTFYAQLSANTNKAIPAALSYLSGPAIAAEFKARGLPDYEALFGSLSGCTCEECRSIVSPAAYLFDLLQFLGPEGRAALAVQRPDIANTALSCANTNTPMPYIDLVNEVLERAVGKGTTLPSDAFNTTLPAEELAAHPENVTPEAYDTLAKAVFPWTLPFSLGLEEARVYLRHLGIEAADLMEVFQSTGPSVFIHPTAQDIAEVRLDLTDADFQQLTDPTGEATDPLTEGVSTFLRLTGSSFDDLLDLLDADFVNPPDTPPDSRLRIAGGELTCDLEQAALVGTSSLVFDHIHRFTRLRRKLGWTAYELDAALRVLRKKPAAGDPPDPDDPSDPKAKRADFILAVAGVQALRASLGTPVLDALGWFGRLSVKPFRGGGRSPYELLFQNPTIFDTVEMDAFRPTGDFLKAGVAGQTVAAHLGAIRAALGAKLEDLQLILDPGTLGFKKDAPATQALAVVPDGALLSLDNVSAIARVVSLARALKLSVRDFVLLRVLTAINPFASPGDARALLVARDAIAAGPFSIAELGEILLGVAPAPGTAALTEDAAASLLTDIQTGLLSIAIENASAVDTTGDRLRKALAAALPKVSDKDVDLMMAFLAGTNQTKDADVAKTAFHQLDSLLDVVGQAPGTAVTQLLAALPPVGDNPASARFGKVLEAILPALSGILSQNFVVQKLATAFRIDVAAMQVLVTQALRSADPTKPVLEDFTSLVGGNPPARVVDLKDRSSAAFQTGFGTLKRVAKAATIVLRFKLSITELTFHIGDAPPLFAGNDTATGSSIGWLNLSLLPVTPMAPATPDFFRSWQGEMAAFRFRDRFAVPGAGVLALLAGAIAKAGTVPPEVDRPAFARRVAGLAGWTFADLTALTAATGGLAFPAADFASGAALDRLMRAEDLLSLLSAPATDVLGWVRNLSGNAPAIKAAAKAKHSRDEWLQVAPPLRDALRIQQRDALVTWLVSDTDEFEDHNALFDRYLIDVDMSPCMLTSRLKQAIGSTQLFIQRSLMQTDSPFTLSPDQIAQWKWRGRFRVWEANRKVLLYPENYLDPTLRDDKTPFFQDFENELSQSSITSDSAETAFRNYLEKVEGVARLVVVATYRDPATKIIHVLARTPGRAPKYYYRTYETVPDASWTPWTAVPLDITDDAVALIVWNRQVHVFWVVIGPSNQPKAEPIKNPKDAAVVTPPPRVLELRIAWSELHNGKWRSKRVSTAAVDSTRVGLSDDKGDARQSLHCDPFLSINDDGGEDLQIGVNSDVPLIAIFNFPGCGGEPSAVVLESLPGTSPPDGQTRVGQWFQNRQNGRVSVLTNATSSVPVLGKSVGTATVVMEAGTIIADRPFFIQDERRSFFVVPDLRLPQWYKANAVDLSAYQAQKFFPYLTPIDQPPPPVVVLLRADASAFDPSARETFFFPAFDDLPARRSSSLIDFSKGFSLAQLANAAFKVVESSTVIQSVRWNKSPQARFTFTAFYHPYVCEALGRLNRFGLDGILSWRFQEQRLQEQATPEIQRLSKEYFDLTYVPAAGTISPGPDQFDVSVGGPYAIYNWEVFFHAPLLIAQKLTANQRFEEAQRWLHFIFDPTDTNDFGSPAQFWKFKRFFDDARAHGVPPNIVDLINGTTSAEDQQAFHAQVQKSVTAPFRPFAIARLRTPAFQKAVFMAYVDNLIAWGDMLFRQNTLESINEATLFYVIATELLGPRPKQIPPAQTPPDNASYTHLIEQGILNDINDPLVKLEDLIGPSDTNFGADNDATGPASLFFCVPPNNELLTRWDTVEDRLFKVRHCMNIEGQVEQLPLFEPPLNPALLVRAAAAGVDLGSVLADKAVPLPFYRFQVMAQKASELAGEVRALGQELLAAMEKRDAEHLALVRANQELEVLKRTEELKQRAIDEAQSAHDALVQSQAIATARKRYYDGLIAAGISASEKLNLDKLAAANVLQQGAQFLQIEATILGLIPEFTLGAAGFGGTAEVNAAFGGRELSGIAQAGAGVINMLASMATYDANRAGINATHERRAQEWAFQSQVADGDIQQIGLQIDAATTRIDIATKDLALMQQQIQNASDVRDFVKDKFTNQALYDFMVKQISATYFTAYQLAFDLAKRAEKGFHREIGDEVAPAVNYIQFGYWDSLEQGLLAGEGLEYDLRRMEAAYLEQNRRELEITKHISLRELDPVALTHLKTTGVCYVDLPEALFNRDFPGHYLRRVKSVALTIPCEVGPYTSVNCTLSLARHRTRWRTLVDDAAYQTPTDPSVAASFGVIESIVTSSGQSDGGLFEVNLRDERYLPFEGVGAISLWKIELPPDTNAFDTGTLTDVVLHVRYTARDGGEALRTAARKKLGLGDAPSAPLPDAPAPLATKRLFLTSQDFSDPFYRFLHPDASTPDHQSLLLDLTDARFPFHDPKKPLAIKKLTVFVVPTAGGQPALDTFTVDLLDPASTATALGSLDKDTTLGDLPAASTGTSFTSFPIGTPAGDTWEIRFKPKDNKSRLDPKAIQEIGVICDFGS